MCEYIDLNKGNKLKYWDKDKFVLTSFKTNDGRIVKYFVKKTEEFNEIIEDEGLTIHEDIDGGIVLLNESGQPLLEDDVKELNNELFEGSVISRSKLLSITEPFYIEPWKQYIVDYAKEYGERIINDMNGVLLKNDDIESVSHEAKRNIVRINDETNYKRVGVNMYLCHPEGYLSGNVKELFYNDATSKYHIGETKTSSSIKFSVLFGIALNLVLLKELNKDLINEISNTAIVIWNRNVKKRIVKKENIDDQKTQLLLRYESIIEAEKKFNSYSNSSFASNLTNDEVVKFVEENALNKYVDKSPTPNDEIYFSYFEKEPKPIKSDRVKDIHNLFEFDLEAFGLIQLAEDRVKQLSDYDIKSYIELKEFIENNVEFHGIEKEFTNRYNELKSKFNDLNIKENKYQFVNKVF